MKLIKADKNMIPMLSDFAKEVFVDYYKDLIGIKQSVYMTGLFLSEEAISDLMDQGAVFILATEDDRPVGFCEYISEGSRLFLSKLSTYSLDRNNLDPSLIVSVQAVRGKGPQRKRNRQAALPQLSGIRQEKRT